MVSDCDFEDFKRFLTCLNRWSKNRLELRNLWDVCSSTKSYAAKLLQWSWANLAAMIKSVSKDNAEISAKIVGNFHRLVLEWFHYHYKIPLFHYFEGLRLRPGGFRNFLNYLNRLGTDFTDDLFRKHYDLNREGCNHVKL